MQVSGVKGSQQAAVGVNRKQSSDSIIREAQDKIAELKERIKSLADDDTLDAESKAEQKKAIAASDFRIEHSNKAKTGGAAQAGIRVEKSP